MTSSGFDLLIFASYGASNDDVEDEVNMMATTRIYGGTIVARMPMWSWLSRKSDGRGRV